MDSCYNPFSLRDKTILITGASSGIGKSIAIECSKMGAKLIITGRNYNRLIETYNNLEGNDHIAIPADLTQESGIIQVIERINKINGAVFCAGISDSSLVSFSSIERFRKVFEYNFFSITELIRLLLKRKKLDFQASLVAISSISAFSYEIGNGIYGAGKAALSAWMRYAARELSTKRIRLNCICPGMIDTPFIHGGAFTENQLNENLKNYPLLRFGRPEEIAYGAIYLLSDASLWVTGIDLVIDGGKMLK